MRTGSKGARSAVIFLVGPEQSAISAERVAGAIPGLTSSEAPYALATAIASSVAWPECDQALLVVRERPTPVLGVAGFFDDVQRVRLEMLVWQLQQTLPGLRYVSYAQAEADCHLLAEKLRQHFGDAVRKDFHYIAMPRGGHVVLGMLAYVLDLAPDRIGWREDTGAPAVVVDDCALSGARFRTLLSNISHPSVVFAHLYSPPALRAAIEQREPSMLACLSARDIKDVAPERLGDRYAAWLEGVRTRRNGEAYWFGQFEKIAFAWTEPDTPFWNLVTNRREPGWNLLPPGLCLKHRNAERSETARIVVQEESPGPIVPAPTVLFADFGETILIGEAISGANYALRGVGADMWRALVKLGDLEQVSASLREQYAVDEEMLKRDLQALAEDLLARGLLEDRRGQGSLAGFE